MMSWKTYLWANSITAGLLLCSAGLALWSYLFSALPDNAWIVLVQVASAVGFATVLALTCQRRRTRMEQARADAMPPPWRPPSAELDW